MLTRDYATEMRKLIDSEAVGTYIPGLVAAAIVEKLRVIDPNLLTGWLDAQAEQFLRMAINDRDRSQRTAARHSLKRSVFAADTKAAEAGEPDRLVRWLDIRFTIADGNHAPLKDLTGTDLQYVSETYENRARENQLTAAFLTAIAKKIGTGRVSEHFTDEQLDLMWGSLGGH